MSDRPRIVDGIWEGRLLLLKLCWIGKKEVDKRLDCKCQGAGRWKQGKGMSHNFIAYFNFTAMNVQETPEALGTRVAISPLECC